MGLMGSKSRAGILLGVLACLGVGGPIALRYALRPAPVVIRADPPKARPTGSLPPGRTLGAAANSAPESLVRAPLAPDKTPRDAPGAEDGVVTTISITTPPFEITKRYRSMEGPFAEYSVRLDAGAEAPKARELWWWKGARIEVLDEDGKPLGQEFMCHLNVDVDGRWRAITLGLEPGSRRLLTLTQGELSFALPRGRGLPVASDETWSFMFQVLNRNRDGRFRVKQRLTLYFVRDADLTAPMDAVNATAASIWVPVDKPKDEWRALDEKECHCCAPPVRGLEATNNIMAGRFVDDAGRTFVGHWVVPPGKSTWTSPIDRYMPKGDGPHALYATWTHVHPFATGVRLIAHAPGCAPKVVTESAITSLKGDRVGLDSIRSFHGPEPVDLPSATYELAVDYDNSSGRAQDSMTSLGMFVGADDWKRPAWADRAQNDTGMDASCGAP
jgi:hypothetical protein